jgi:alkaline phosphatase D
VDKSPSIKKGYIVGDTEVRQKGHETLAAPGYLEMLASGTKVIGVWDDHDFGFDNEDKDFKGKHQNREAFLDFVGEPE